MSRVSRQGKFDDVNIAYDATKTAPGAEIYRQKKYGIPTALMLPRAATVVCPRQSHPPPPPSPPCDVLVPYPLRPSTGGVAWRVQRVPLRNPQRCCVGPRIRRQKAACSRAVCGEEWVESSTSIHPFSAEETVESDSLPSPLSHAKGPFQTCLGVGVQLRTRKSGRA